MIRKYGVAETVAAASAYLKVILEKYLILAQNKFQSDPYLQWQKTFEAGAQDDPEIEAGGRLLFVLYAAGAETTQRTLGSLVQQTASGDAVLFDELPSAAQSFDNSAGVIKVTIIPAETPLSRSEILRNAAGRAGDADWVVWAPAGTLFSPRFIQTVRRAIQSNPGAEIFYWDEDQIGPDNRRSNPFFKPTWSPETWLSVDLLRSGAVSAKLLRRAALEGGGDFFARLLSQSAEPCHIPAVLTQFSESTSRDPILAEEHTRAVIAWIRAEVPGIELVERENMESPLAWKVGERLVSIVIPTYNNYEYLKKCIDSLTEKTTYPNYEVILMDGSSSDPNVLAYYDTLRQNDRRIQIHQYQADFNFSRVCNQGAELARGDYLVFLNNDVEITRPDWIENLVMPTLLPGVGIAGAMLLYPDETIQHAGIVVGMTGHAGHVNIGKTVDHASAYGSCLWLRSVSAVTGACLLMPRSVFIDLGGFSEAYQLVFSDVELCVRARARGYRCVINPRAQLIHHEGKTRANRIPVRDIVQATRDLGDLIRDGDPWYSTNLSRAVSEPTFRRKNEIPPLKRVEFITDWVTRSRDT